MPSPTAARRWLLAVPLVALAATDCPAIEMFTFFGDGSRIGLPSLEVPVEAYPGIPLRSDRLRARRRAMRAGPAAARVSPPGYGRGITIRSMPADAQGATAGSGRHLDPIGSSEPLAEPPRIESEPLEAPDPDDVIPPSTRP
ncbi:MAG: hypothetical protein ACKOCX_08135 [Planctomycetota bacterium]